MPVNAPEPEQIEAEEVDRLIELATTGQLDTDAQKQIVPLLQTLVRHGYRAFAAQALAEVMLARGWRVRLSTDARGARFTGGFPHSTEIARVSSASFAQGGALARLLTPFRVAALSSMVVSFTPEPILFERGSLNSLG